MYGRKLMMLTILSLLVLSLVAMAADAPAEQEETVEVLTKVQIRMQQKVNVDFRETPIEDVLRMLAKQADVDIVKSPVVIGNVTATLSDIPLDEALDNILAAHGYGYIATENMIRIVPRSEILNIQEPLENRVYHITYADVKELEKALTKFLSTRGSISSMPGTSNIIITDTASKIKAIDKFIEQVDRVTQQVLVEVRIYDVTDTDNFNLDIAWNAGRNTENTSGDQVTQTTGQGIDYVNELAQGVPADGIPIQAAKRRTDPYAAGSFDQTTGGSVRLGFFNDSFSLDVMLTALEKEEYATLLANPSIMVLDNETATFEIVEEIPYKEERQSSAGGSQTSTQFKEVGVELEVTPKITRDDMLRLQIAPEFGVAGPQVVNDDGDRLVPVVNTRRLNTVALLKNGETVVLGGLRKQEVSKILSKTPLLGDLPLLGPLFRSENEETETTELLVFITPRIIDIPVIQSHEAQTLEYTDVPKVDYPKLRQRSKR
jgi:type IV pilus assembly protein PilQ